MDLGLWFAIALVLLWILLDKRRTALSGPVAIGAAAAACLAACILMNRLCPDGRTLSPRWGQTVQDRVKSAEQKQETLQALLEECEQLAGDEADPPLVIAAGGVNGDSIFEPFDIPEKGLFDNIIWLGGWEAFSAAFYETLHVHQVENAFRDVINRDDIVLAAVNDVDRVVKYIRAHYDEQAREEQIGQMKQFVICRVVSGKD